MFKIHQTLALAICLFIGFNQPVFADDDGLLVIREVFVDVPSVGQVLIIGEGFGTAPTVEFGAFGDIGFESATDSEIIINLPTVGPGEFLIIVTAGGEDDDDDDGASDEYDLTIGSAAFPALEQVTAVGDLSALATCPTGKTVLFGYKTHWNTSNAGATKPGFGACTSGLTTCSTSVPNLAGNDEVRVWIVCQ